MRNTTEKHTTSVSRKEMGRDDVTDNETKDTNNDETKSSEDDYYEAFQWLLKNKSNKKCYKNRPRHVLLSELDRSKADETFEKDIFESLEFTRIKLQSYPVITALQGRRFTIDEDW